MAKLTSQALPSEFCAYPIFKFNEMALEKADPHYFREYQKFRRVELKARNYPSRSSSSMSALRLG